MDVDLDSVMNSLGTTEVGVHVESMGKFSYQKVRHNQVHRAA